MIIPSAYQWVVDNYSVLTASQEIQLFKQLGDTNLCADLRKRARDTIFYSNLRLVFKVASNFKNRGSKLDLDDLISEGIFGLNKAIEKFDYTLGWKFSTYAFNWVRSFISRQEGLQNDTIRKPCHLRQEYIRIKKFIREYESKHGATPSISYIAKELQLTSDKVRLTLSSMKFTTSIDKLVGENQDTTLIDLLANSHALGGADSKISSPTYELEQLTLTESLLDLLETLNPIHKRVIELRYGLNGNTPMSLQKVGDVMGCSREMVRLREKKALCALRGHRDTDTLKELYTGS